jgi:alpha-beta hydrolase superfamily lysophospholipase
MATLPIERFTLRANDGFVISAMRWLPAAAPRAVLVIAHGMAEYAARYDAFALHCASAGVAVYALDHRGHGASIAEDTPRGHFADDDGWSKVQSDLDLLRTRAAESHAKVPLFFFGHSMGSFIGREYLLTRSATLDGAILSATGWRAGALNRVLRWVADREVAKNGPRAPSARMRKLVFGSFNLRFLPSRTAFDWLSRDPKVVDAYIADPLCGFDCSGKLWSDLLGATSAIEQREDDPKLPPRGLPLLLIAGSHDAVSMGGLGHGQVAARYRAAGNTHVDDRRYPEGRHELLNETNRDEVWRDVLAWITDRSPKR